VAVGVHQFAAGIPVVSESRSASRILARHRWSGGCGFEEHSYHVLTAAGTVVDAPAKDLPA
jgi:hypothetical protein